MLTFAYIIGQNTGGTQSTYNLLSNKMRALLTMLGIIIGIGSVIAIITVGDSLTLSVSENMQSMGATDVYILVQRKNEEEEKSNIDGIKYGTFNSGEGMTEEDYLTEDMIKEMCNKFKDDIYAVNLQYTAGQTQIELGKNVANVNVSGVTAGYFITNEINLISGRMFSGEEFSEGKNAIIVSDRFVNKLFDGDYRKALGSIIEVSVN